MMVMMMMVVMMMMMMMMMMIPFAICLKPKFNVVVRLFENMFTNPEDQHIRCNMQQFQLTFVMDSHQLLDGELEGLRTNIHSEHCLEIMRRFQLEMRQVQYGTLFQQQQIPQSSTPASAGTHQGVPTSEKSCNSCMSCSYIRYTTYCSFNVTLF